MMKQAVLTYTIDVHKMNRENMKILVYVCMYSTDMSCTSIRQINKVHTCDVHGTYKGCTCDS